MRVLKKKFDKKGKLFSGIENRVVIFEANPQFVSK